MKKNDIESKWRELTDTKTTDCVCIICDRNIEMGGQTDHRTGFGYCHRC
jgi:hypothetical protein